jgi:purine-binding chemotaxis protein CheW
VAHAAEQTSPDVLVFEVEGHRYGVPASAVRELLRAVAVTPLPQAPPGVDGVIDLRGQVFPVLDVRTRFGLPARPATPSDHLVVVESGGRRIALRVDRAVELVAIKESEAAPAADLVPGAGGRVARSGGHVVLIPDLATLLAPADRKGGRP